MTSYLVYKFPTFYGTRRFITALISIRHLTLPWASPIQSIYPHPTSWRSILILSTHLRLGLPSGLLPSGFPTNTLYTPSPHPYAPHAQTISLFSILSPAQYWVRSTNHLAPRYAISSIPPLPLHSSVQIFSSTPCSVLKHPHLPFFPQCQRPRPRLQYLQQVARNREDDSYTAMKRMACNNCRWKAANQSKD